MSKHSYGFCPRCSGKISIPGITMSLCRQCGWVVPEIQPQAQAVRLKPTEAVLRITEDFQEPEPEEPETVVESFEQIDLWGGLL